MRDSFDNIRAEREPPYRTVTASQSNRFSGLWKQIVIGVVVGHFSLALIGAVVWLIATQLLLSALPVAAPWSTGSN